MDLFTYLMAKNGHNTSVHGDLFSYLLGKGQSQTQTISGVTIYIPNAKKLVSFMLTKESTQIGTPTPDNPVEVNVVEGYRNLFDKDNATTQIGYVKIDGSLSDGGNSTVTSSYTEITPNLNYTVNGFLLETIAFYDNSYNFIKRVTSINTTHYTFNENASYIRIQGKTVDFNINTLQLTEGNQELPYVSYGNNYVNVAVSDGTNTNNYPIPLNNNELVGIGDYKDELLVDKSGHCWLNKLTGKVVLDGTENWGIGSNEKWFYYNNTLFPMSSSGSVITPSYSNYYLPVSYNQAYGGSVDYGFAFGYNVKRIAIRNKDITTTSDFKTWLSTHNTEVYYVLETPELIDLQTTVDLKLFKGVNNVSNSVDGYMTIKYK